MRHSDLAAQVCVPADGGHGVPPVTPQSSTKINCSAQSAASVTTMMAVTSGVSLMVEQVQLAVVGQDAAEGLLQGG